MVRNVSTTKTSNQNESLTHQQPAVIQLCELVFKVEHQHQQDTTHDNRRVLDKQRRLGH